MNNNSFYVNFYQKFQNEKLEFEVLLKSVPPILLTLFVIAVFLMNLMANKSINLPFDWMALDCGILVSWFVFLALDVLTKHFGPKAATQLSILATIINLGLCLIFYVVSIIPGTWSEAYVVGSEVVIGTALDNTFGGTWYIILGSAVAFLIAALVNNFLNFSVGKVFKNNPDSMTAYFSRAYISTAFAQFTDNFVFAFVVSRTFFGWSITQCIVCSLLGMLAELICEMIFSFEGYRICTKWKKNKIGEEYFKYVREMA